MKEDEGNDMNKHRNKTNLKGNRLLYAGSVFMIIPDVILTISIAFLMQKLIDAGVEGNGDLMIDLLLISGAILISFVIVGIVQYKLQNLYTHNTLIKYKSYIIDSFLKKDLKGFKINNTGTYISMMNNDISHIETDYIRGNFLIIKQILLFVITVVAMNMISYKIFLVTLACSLLPLIASVIFGNNTKQKLDRVSKDNSSFTTSIKDMFSGFTVIKSFNIEKELADYILNSNAKLENTKKGYNNIVDLVSILSQASSFIVVIAAFGFGTYLTINGEVTAGSVIAIIQLLNYMLGPISQLSELLNKRGASKELIYKIERLISNETDGNARTHKKDSFSDLICFEDVSFSYDGKNDVLKNVSFTLEKGKSYALVGLSGSGKSTIINLLMGYYDSYKGSIFIDDVELRAVDTDYLYKLLTNIQQDVFMFDDTLENNITLYKNYHHKKIMNASTNAELSGFIKDKGLNYICGENGGLLSGGEKQRVSIARALVRDTPILLLDEATAALDNATSYAIEQTILNIEDATRIVVTHKLNKELLARYDEILVMNNGQIVECGTFDELLRLKGNFYSIYHITSSDGDKENKRLHEELKIPSYAE